MKPCNGAEFFSRYPKPPVFHRYQEGDYTETEEGYARFESLCKKLIEQFKFLYEYYGSVLPPNHPADLHIHPFLVQASQKSAKTLAGIPVQLPEDGSDPFGETGHSHLQRLFVFGAPVTDYPNEGFFACLHNTGYEGYTGIRQPLAAFADAEELVPLIFSTDHNFYTELTNATFLRRDAYLTPPRFPIYHPLHREVFTTAYFKKIGLDPLLLELRLSKETVIPDPALEEAAATVNFALCILYSAILIQSAFTDFYGFSQNKAEMITFFKKQWRYPGGAMTAGINPFHLHVLNYFLSASHLCAYMTAYCLYRHKYGDVIPNPAHTSVYLGKKQRCAAFKDFLDRQIRVLLGHYGAQPDSLPTLKGLLYLASLWGVGYQTRPIVGRNDHTYVPADYSDCFAGRSVPEGLNPLVRHNPNSPLWRLWFTYGGSFWRRKRENRHIFQGKGRFWTHNRRNPRAWLYRVGYAYSKAFWTDKFTFLLSAKGKNNPALRPVYRRILKQL